MKQAWWVHIYRCGLHSGFRRCCIRWFVREWWPRALARQNGDSAAAAYMAGYLERAVKVYAERHGYHKTVGYVPCPECIKFNRPPVPVRSCYFPDKNSRCRPVPTIAWRRRVVVGGTWHDELIPWKENAA